MFNIYILYNIRPTFPSRRLGHVIPQASSDVQYIDTSQILIPLISLEPKNVLIFLKILCHGSSPELWNREFQWFYKTITSIGELPSWKKSSLKVVKHQNCIREAKTISSQLLTGSVINGWHVGWKFYWPIRLGGSGI